MKPNQLLKASLACLALFLLAYAYVLIADGQTRPEPKIETCIVDVQNEDKTKTIHCETFDFIVTGAWPREWDLYKSKGEKVQVQVEGERFIPIAPSCRERIRKAYFQRVGLLKSVDTITPEDCRFIPIAEREGYTRGPK